MRHVSLVSLVLSVFVSTAYAGGGTPIVYGSGVGSRGKWLAADSNAADHATKLNWVLGWLSAAGNYNARGELKETDSAAISAWIDNYRHAHPLDLICQAADALVIELSSAGSGTAEEPMADIAAKLAELVAP